MAKGFIPLNEDGTPKDISLDSTSQEIKDAIGQDSGSTISSKLSDILDKLIELFNTGVAKIKIWDGNEITDVLDDGEDKRLAVDAKISGGEFSFQLQAFTPAFELNTDIVTNEITDTTLFSKSGQRGKIDFIAISGSNSSYEVIIEVDSLEILRIQMSTLGSDIGLANATNVPLWVETANKNFRFSPDEGVDYTDNFAVKVKATGSPTPTINFLVNHRDTD